MDAETYIKLRSVRCKNKHKYRTNTYGVTWCMICGLLGGYNTTSKPLTDNDKMVIG